VVLDREPERVHERLLPGLRRRPRVRLEIGDRLRICHPPYEFAADYYWKGANPYKILKL
jgi:hypothetical protein